ncbi:hypothetical protein [Corallococcus sp. EGB]|uniref:hypothetical protein n=1 Tax=Corallococcus sp. EGB TaxID=1521117 RepID=UPI001CC0F2DC|nr:hypothetical protein [Corallococcus sp. EGB]
MLVLEGERFKALGPLAHEWLGALLGSRAPTVPDSADDEKERLPSRHSALYLQQRGDRG